MIFLLITTLLFLTTSIYFAIPWFKRYIQARKFREAYMSDQSPLTVVYTDKTGQEWLHFQDYGKLPRKRLMDATFYSRHAELCLTPEMFDKYIEAIRIAFNEGDHSKAASYVERMKERRTWAGEKRTLELLINVYFMLPGEDPLEASTYWLDKKREIWAKDSDCHAFFLTAALATIRSFKDLSQSAILEYLNVKELEDSL